MTLEGHHVMNPENYPRDQKPENEKAKNQRHASIFGSASGKCILSESDDCPVRVSVQSVRWSNQEDLRTSQGSSSPLEKLFFWRCGEVMIQPMLRSDMLPCASSAIF
jgi:hypothetical protein